MTSPRSNDLVESNSRTFEETPSYTATKRLGILGAKKFGKPMWLHEGMIWEWVCKDDAGDVHIRHDESDPVYITTMLYLRGQLLYRLDDCEEALAILRKYLLLDELANV